MANRKKKNVLILGTGNILLKDEGLGVKAVEAFKRRYTTPEYVTCMDGGTGGMKLLPVLKGLTHLIIIDAIASDSPPGSIHKFYMKDISNPPKLMTTTHQIGIKELLQLASFKGYDPQVTLIGMAPNDISPGLELSPLVKGRLPRMTDTIKDELKKIGVTIKERLTDA